MDFTDSGRELNIGVIIKNLKKGPFKKGVQ